MSDLNLEESLKKLEEISKSLESPDLPLDEAMKNFEDGLEIIKKCNKILNQTEAKIVDLTDSQIPNINPEDDRE